MSKDIKHDIFSKFIKKALDEYIKSITNKFNITVVRHADVLFYLDSIKSFIIELRGLVKPNQQKDKFIEICMYGLGMLLLIKPSDVDEKKFLQSTVAEITKLYNDKYKLYGNSLNNIFDTFGYIAFVILIAIKRERLLNFVHKINVDSPISVLSDNKIFVDNIFDLIDYCIIACVELEYAKINSNNVFKILSKVFKIRGK